MKLRQHSSAAAFLASNEKFLEKEEATNSLLLGLTYANKVKAKDDSLYLDLIDEDGIQFSAIKTPGRNLIIYGNKERVDLIIPPLIQYLKINKIDLPGINGPKNLILLFATAIKEELHWDYRIEFEHWVYKLTDLPIKSNTKLTLANLSQIELVAQWMKAFYKEVLNEINDQEALDIALTKTKAQEVYLWPQENPMTMSCIARPTNKGISINYVYTPPESRGKGYASQTVAALSETMLRKGYLFCALFADAKNKSTNRLYKKIGYRQLEEFLTIKFNKRL